MSSPLQRCTSLLGMRIRGAHCRPALARRCLASRADMARDRQAAATASTAFPAHYQQLARTVAHGVAPLASANEGFELTTGQDGSLALDVAGVRRFTLQPDAATAQVVLAMPATSFSGGGDMRYRFDERTAAWLDVTNGHHLVEKLVRDLVASCKGCPEF